MMTPTPPTASAVATTRSLQIDGMTGDACVEHVKSALKSVQGVTTQSVELGKAVITSDSPAAFGAATAALRSAGYMSRETIDSSGKNGCSTAEAKPAKGAEAQTAAASRDMTSEGAGGAIGGPNPGKPEEKRTEAPVVATKATPLVAPVGAQ